MLKLKQFELGNWNNISKLLEIQDCYFQFSLLRWFGMNASPPPPPRIENIAFSPSKFNILQQKESVLVLFFFWLALPTEFWENNGWFGREDFFLSSCTYYSVNIFCFFFYPKRFDFRIRPIPNANASPHSIFYCLSANYFPLLWLAWFHHYCTFSRDFFVYRPFYSHLVNIGSK